VDRAWAMRRALRLGVDGVITNRPDLLRSVLEAE
jgi:glycerophosphoryl diester phosphodiesterase